MWNFLNNLKKDIFQINGWQLSKCVFCLKIPEIITDMKGNHQAKCRQGFKLYFLPFQAY